jgi:enamine deaminase RidA (YjgF/YER057c/UK114 family)
MEMIRRVLAGFGAKLDDVVKVLAFYEGSASHATLHENLSIRSSSFSDPGPATTGVPFPHLAYQKMVIEIDVYAIKR